MKRHFEITPIPAFEDNYIWALHAEAGHERCAVLIDPGEPDAILAWLEAHRTRPLAVLVTHHHGDHTGAIRALARRWPITVHGPARENIPGLTHPLADGDIFQEARLKLRFEALETPGHTLGHLCYLGHGALFSGDTLFSAGCGRLFEGSAAQMHASLERLAALPGATEVYCAHEYTLANLAFAREVEPGNNALDTRLASARAARAQGAPTLPSQIALERATNPFLRCRESAVQAAVARHYGRNVEDAETAFRLLREWRNGIRAMP